MDFDRWFSNQSLPRQVKQLTERAQRDRDSFEASDDEYGRLSDRGCTCFLSPPCGWCTHPGNPLNQEEDEAWELVNGSDVTRTVEEQGR